MANSSANIGFEKQKWLNIISHESPIRYQANYGDRFNGFWEYRKKGDFYVHDSSGILQWKSNHFG